METLRSANILNAPEIGQDMDAVYAFIFANLQRSTSYQEHHSPAFVRGIEKVGAEHALTPDGLRSLLDYILTKDQESHIDGGVVQDITIDQRGVQVVVASGNDMVIVPELWAFSQVVYNGIDGMFVPVHFELVNPKSSLMFRANSIYCPDLPITTSASSVSIEGARPLIPKIPDGARYSFRRSYGHIGEAGDGVELHAHHSRGGIRVGTIGERSHLYAEDSTIMIGQAPKGVASFKGYDSSLFHIESLGTKTSSRRTRIGGDCTLTVGTVNGDWSLDLQRGTYGISAEAVPGNIYIDTTEVKRTQIHGSYFNALVMQDGLSVCYVDPRIDKIYCPEVETFADHRYHRHQMLRVPLEYMSTQPTEVTSPDRDGIAIGSYPQVPNFESHVAYYQNGMPVVVADSFREAQKFLSAFPDIFMRRR